MEFQKDIGLDKYTSFKIGGPAKFFYIAKNKDDLIEAIKKAKEAGLAFFILGEGTNALALDKGYEGLVIKIGSSEFETQDSNIISEAGVSLGKLVDLANDSSLSGLEWATGVPGTIGGAVYGNAGAFETKISNTIKEVEALDTNNLSIKVLSKEECKFSEKNSVFKKNKNLIILSVVLELEKRDKSLIEKKMEENLRFRKERQPLDYPSAGSIFINLESKERSSALIDKAGLKGAKVGGAEISEKHAGFIINTGDASSTDVLELIDIVKKKIKSKYDIDLEQEVQIIE